MNKSNFFLIVLLLILPIKYKKKVEAKKEGTQKKNVSLKMNTNETIVLDELKAQGFTPEARAAIMGVVGGESNFQMFKETGYNNTSNSRIRNIFGDTFINYSDNQLSALKSDYNDFFNVAYGYKYGNTAPNDGSKYVGRGFNGITFKGNYQAAQNATGINFVANPELMENPRNAAKALAAYFQNEKDIKDFELAFQEAYRRNAGYGNSWNYYNTSTNAAHVGGIKTKRAKAEAYYNASPKKKLIWLFIAIIVGVAIWQIYKNKLNLNPFK